MRVLITVSFLIAAAAQACAGDVRVFIAPRTPVVPQSHKVSFDIYWINNGTRTAAIPALQRYSFTYSPLGPGSTVFGVEAMSVDHPSVDRRIEPGAIVHDRATAGIDAKGAKLVEVTAEFHGDKSTSKSNTVVLRTTR